MKVLNLSKIEGRHVTETIGDGSTVDYEDGTLEFTSDYEDPESMILIEISYLDSDGYHTYSLAIDKEDLAKAYKVHCEKTI